MATPVYSDIKAAFKSLNPQEVRELAERPVRVGLVVSSAAGADRLERFFLPDSLSESRRAELRDSIQLVESGGIQTFDFEIWEEGLPLPAGAYRFDSRDPGRTVREVLAGRPELGLPLARLFPPFRKPVVERVVHSVAKENAAFSVVTALPDIMPSLLELPWAVGEFASDTAFLTMNQVRMAFLIAAASDHDVGYRDQASQIAGIVGSAFGWRALARELVGKIPFGAGLIPKAAVAYAGTYVVGKGLERFYRLGYGLTRAEKREIYDRALERGKGIVNTLLHAARLRQSA